MIKCDKSCKKHASRDPKILIDWDYHSGIKSKASIIHIKQYKHWRETGIGYEFGDQEYSEPNKSLVTFAEGFLKRGKDHGLKKEVSSTRFPFLKLWSY